MPLRWSPAGGARRRPPNHTKSASIASSQRHTGCPAWPASLASTTAQPSLPAPLVRQSILRVTLGAAPFVASGSTANQNGQNKIIHPHLAPDSTRDAPGPM